MMIEIMSDSLVNAELNIKSRLVEPAILVTLSPDSISAKINKDRRLNPDGFNQATVFIHTLEGAAVGEPGNIDKVDEVELLQLIDSTKAASHSLDRTAALLRNNRTNKNISSEDNKNVREEARLLAGKYANYSAILREEFQRRRNSDQAEPSSLPDVLKRAGEVGVAGVTIANTAGGVIDNRVNQHVRTIDEVFAGAHPYYINDLQNKENDVRTINLTNLKKAATLAQSLDKNGRQGGDPKLPPLVDIKHSPLHTNLVDKQDGDKSQETIDKDTVSSTMVPTPPEKIDQGVSIGSVELHKIPKSSEQRLLDTAHLKDIPSNGVMFEATNIDQVNQVLNMLEGNNELNDPELLQSIANNWATIVQMNQQYGDGSGTMQFYLFKDGISQGISFKKDALNFQNSGVDILAGSFWGADGKQLLRFDPDVKKLDSSKIDTGIFIVPVASYMDSLQAASDKGIDLSSLPKDGYIIAQLLSVKGVTDKHWLISAISPDGKNITFTIPAIANLMNDTNQMNATEVPADLTNDLFAKAIPEIVPAPNEITKTAPEFIYSQDGSLTQDKIRVVVQRPDGNIVAITEAGTELYYMPGEEQYNNWFIKVKDASTDNVTVLMSAAMYSRDNVLKTEKIFTAQNQNPALKHIQDGVTTIAALKIHDTRLSSLRGSQWPTYHPNLNPIYGNEPPSDGSVILNKSLEYVLSIASKDGGKTVVLADGTTWDVSKGIDFIIRRDLSDSEISNMNQKNTFAKDSWPTKISTDENGKLRIENLSFLQNGVSLTTDWQIAMNLLLAPYDKKVVVHDFVLGREIKTFDPETVNIITPSDGNGSFTWIWDALTSRENLTTSSVNKTTWIVK